MPKGYKTVSIKEEIHKELQDFADQTHRSIPGTIEYLIDKCRAILEREKLEVPA